MKSKMRYREQKFHCGNYLEVNMFPVFECVYKSSNRKSRRKPTSKVQEKLNQHNAEKSLTRIINTNFTNKDIKLELTYSEENHPASVEQAQRDIVNFFRRINRARNKAGLEKVKYIYSLEQGSRKKRFHFHVVMSGGLSINDISKIWGKGYVNKVLPLMFNETGCVGIAKYFSKQQVKTATGKSKRWVSSHNCVKPVAQNNDYKLTKRKVNELALESENRRLFEKLYPDYFCASCKPFYNDETGLYYLYLVLYKKSAELDI